MTNEQCHPNLCQCRFGTLWGTNYSMGDFAGTKVLVKPLFITLAPEVTHLHNNGCILDFMESFLFN